MIDAVTPAAAPLADAGASDAADPSAAVLRTFFRFLRLHRRITARATQEYRRIGLSIPQFDVLSTLSEQEGQSQQELAERLYVTKGNVSGLIDRMAAQGLVERRALAGDRRSNALFLTDEGRALTQKGMALQRSLVAATLGALPGADIAALDRLLVAWRDQIRAMPPSEA